MELGALHAEVGTVAAEFHAVAARLLSSLLAFQESDEWAHGGVGTLSQWASVNLGLSAATTRQMVATGEALSKLPELSRRLAEGRLSYDKARVLARVCTPDSEARWVEVAALASATQLERIAAAYRRANADPTPNEDRDRHSKRSLYIDRRDDGFVRLVAFLEAEEAALVVAAVEAETERAWRGLSDKDREPANAEPLSARQADALVAVAETALDAKAAPMVAGRRPELIVHIDAELLAQSAEVGLCHLEGGLTISTETARRICCDAVIRPLIKDATGRILDFGRARRTPSRRQRRALEARDGGCVFPGCPNARFVDAHHIHHWTKGGKTNLDNLCLLCKRHHRLHHEGGYRMMRDRTGRLRFFTDYGYEIGPPPDIPPILYDANGRRIDPNLPRAEAGGEPFDLQLTIATLTQGQRSDGAA